MNAVPNRPVAERPASRNAPASSRVGGGERRRHRRTTARHGGRTLRRALVTTLVGLLCAGGVACEQGERPPASTASTERTAPPPETGASATPDEPGRATTEPRPRDAADRGTSGQPLTVTGEIDGALDDTLLKVKGLAEELGLIVGGPVPLGGGRLYTLSMPRYAELIVADAPESSILAQGYVLMSPTENNTTRVVIQSPAPVLRRLPPKMSTGLDVFERFTREMQSSF